MSDRLYIFAIMLAIILVGSAGLALLGAPFLWAASRLPLKFRWRASRAQFVLALKCISFGAVFTACMSTLVGTSLTHVGVWLAAMPGALIFTVIPSAALDRLPEAPVFILALTFSSLFWALVALAAVRGLHWFAARPAVA